MLIRDLFTFQLGIGLQVSCTPSSIVVIFTPAVGRNRCNLIHAFGWLTIMQPDARQKAIGIRNRENLEEMLESHSILPFTQRLGWTAEQVGWMVAGAKQEMQDARLKLYLPL
jgi:hypothetical protein